MFDAVLFQNRPPFMGWYFIRRFFDSTPFPKVLSENRPHFQRYYFSDSTPISKVLFFNFDPIFRTPKRSKRPPYDPPRGKIMEDWRPKKYLIVPPRRKQMRRGRMSEWSAINKQMFHQNDPPIRPSKVEDYGRLEAQKVPHSTSGEKANEAWENV